MKKSYAIIPTLLLIVINIASAKTYTLTSGKWTDVGAWINQYPGSTIKTDDIVVITGQVTVNTGIVVEGTLQVEKGASMVGMKDLVILKSGRFVNNGNTVMKSISNEGSIQNNLIMESMMDFDNHGNIGNNNCVVGGNNFNNFGGDANGKNGAYFINNNLHSSQSSSFGKTIRMVVGNQIETSENVAPASPFNISASLSADNSVELTVSNPTQKEVAMFSIEKSTDGKNYTVLNIVSNVNKKGEIAMSYTDIKMSSDLTYYRIKAINAQGEETVLPVATVKAPYNNAFTLAKE